MTALWARQIFDWPLLLVACIIGSATAAVTFSLLERLNAARGFAFRFWLLIGALTSGIGLWSSYLLGTVAQRLSVEYAVSVSGQLLVLVTAVGVAGAALALTHAARTGKIPWLVVGTATSLAYLLMYQAFIASLQLPDTWHPKPIPALIWVLSISLSSSIILRVISSRRPSPPGRPGLKLLVCMAVGPVIVASQITGILFLFEVPPTLGTTPMERPDALLVAAPTVTGTLTILLLTTIMIAAERRAQEFFALSAERSPDVLISLDRQCHIYHVNAKAAALLGETNQALAGKPAHLALPPELFETLRSPLQQILRHSDTITVEAYYPRTQCWFEVILYPWPDHIAIVLRDISERKHLEQQIRHQALHDPLTGLGNRVLFREEVEKALREPTGGPGQVAVLFLDLDDFKPINDSYGHTMGDQFLVAVARRLQQCVRSGDIVCRLGGDEFAVLLRQGGGRAAEQVTDQILAALQHPFQVAELSLSVSTSIGIAVAADGETDAEMLLQQADMAMYSAKAQGLGSRQRFDAAMQQTVLERFALKAELSRALENQELLLHYQPIVCLKTGRIRCLEALVRWHHPVRGQLSPADFIPLAEESGLIAAVDDWVLEQACRQLQRWQTSCPEARDLTVSVNLSAREFDQGDLLARVASVLARTGLPAPHLTLEVTETSLLRGSRTLIPAFEGLKSLGVRLAIDDFGTGYSSLTHLQHFPFDILKIDKSFLREVRQNPRDSSLLSGIIHLATGLQLQVIAEGVEYAEQADLLRGLGCSYGQGYHFARPLPVDEIEQHLLNLPVNSPR